MAESRSAGNNGGHPGRPSGVRRSDRHRRVDGLAGPPGAQDRYAGGADIAFVSGQKYFRDYVVPYTNASALLTGDFTDTQDLDGVFSGLDTEHRITTSRNGDINGFWANTRGVHGQPAEGVVWRDRNPRQRLATTTCPG
jgi:hypothetical protein